MKLDQYSNPIFQDHDIFSLLYSGNIDSLNKIILAESPEVNQLIENANLTLKLESTIDYSPSLNEQDSINQSKWNIPAEYLNFDVLEYCIEKCSTDEERIRVLEELAVFEEKKMIPVLQVLKYLVDTFRENKIVWGVGRGSSVSSYVLFLIGIHKINSLQYDLDWREFLR